MLCCDFAEFWQDGSFCLLAHPKRRDAMHKLRLRSKSKSGKQQQQSSSNSNNHHDEIQRHDAYGPPTSATPPAQLALTLGPSNDFRTSLILVGLINHMDRSCCSSADCRFDTSQPDLFARLRTQDGSLISMDQIQSHL